VIVALNFGVVTWSVAMAIYGIVSKAALFLIAYATMRVIGGRRYRRQHLHEVADAPLRAVA
jgi:intracellular septation protein